MVAGIVSTYLVVSRGPWLSLHFDIVPALSRGEAEELVLAKRGGAVAKEKRGWGAVALTLEEVEEVRGTMLRKSGVDLLEKLERETKGD